MRPLASDGARTSLRELVRIVGGLAVAALLLHVLGIGCPIKFATGLSCPGCGMTRAWICALTGRLRMAFAYHPLFWLPVPICLIVLTRHRMSTRTYRALLWACIGAIVIVWVIRLASPSDAAILFDDTGLKDVVGLDEPGWLAAIHTLVDTVIAS